MVIRAHAPRSAKMSPMSTPEHAPRAHASVSPPHRPTRRGFLIAGGGALAALLTGCGVRLERDAPPLPLIPTREVDRRALAVYGELRYVREARAVASSSKGGPQEARFRSLEQIHSQQEGVLLSRLRELGEDPADEARLSGAFNAAQAKQSGSNAPQPKKDSSPAGKMIAAEEAGLGKDMAGRLGDLPRSELPLLMSLRVQRSVAVPLLGGPAGEIPGPATYDQKAAGQITESFRAAEYGLTVAAARTNDATRKRIQPSIDWVVSTRIAVQRLADETPMVSPGGYTLPFNVTSDETAIRLGHVVLSSLTDALLSSVPAACGHSPALHSILTWAARSESSAVALGAELRPFPGLQTRQS